MSPDTALIRWDENESGDSDLPFSTRFGDHYYSRDDGRAETRHVFLGGNGLPQRWEGRERFVIGELGFGTGLNFLETWACWREHRSPGQHLLFQSVEAFPMSEEEMQQALSAWPDLAEMAKGTFLPTDVRESPFYERQTALDVDEQTTLACHIGPAEREIASFSNADAWFLDGFSPARNPDMWSRELMQAVADRTVSGGTFASYTAAGWVRRNLQEAGFIVEKRPGFGTKRDMIAGVKP